MPQPSRPRGLPLELLSDPVMVEACRVRDFGRIFQLAKSRAGVYPSMIARRCDLTPSRVGEVMAGRRQLLHMDVVERIADGLRIPGHMLGLARRDWEPPPTPSGLLGEQHRPRSSSAAFPSVGLDDVLTLVAERDLTASTLTALHSAIADYWRRDDEHGGETLRPALVGHLRYVMALLRQQPSPAIRNGLHGVAAELARLTGWTYFDARHHRQARGYFTEALGLAKAIDDSLFVANVLACMSLQATYQDKPADALALVRAAQDQAEMTSMATPRLAAMLAMREAFAHASLGNRSAAHSAISAAHASFERITVHDPDPAWVAYFDEPKLIADTGIVHGQLGEVVLAEPLIADALRRESPAHHRSRAFHTFWLARVQLRRGSLDQACHTATAALVPAGAVASPRLTGHLLELYEELRPFHSEPAATDFGAGLRRILPHQFSGSPRP